MNASIKIKDVTNFLESWAPLSYQENYDNAGLLTGNPSAIVTGILVTLDCTEDVVSEAIKQGCNVIVAHHPILFKGLKRLTGGNYVERTILKAIKHDVAIYAIHTNLDNIHTGVNRKICDKIGLKNARILLPKADTLNKLVTFIPKENADSVIQALYAAGAGQIGQYKNCSFQLEGVGSFMPMVGANPAIGEALQQTFVTEIRAELIFPSHKKREVIAALKRAHPYEEAAYDIVALSNENQEVGSGMIGELETPMDPLAFLQSLKAKMEVEFIRHTTIVNKAIKKVAVCGGAGIFLLSKAIQEGADVFVTSDVKYHEFFEADNQILLADIGHYESEVFTKELLMDVLMKKFHTFAIIFSKTQTNPISYI